MVKLEKTKPIQISGQTYTVKRFNARERAEIYERATVVDEKTNRPRASTALIMLWTVTEGLVEPKLTFTQVEQMDGALFDALFNAINDFNSAPLPETPRKPS